MMKSHLLSFALVATAAVTLAAKPAFADANVKVPFSFLVGGKRCPAGTYQVKGDSTGKSVTMVGRDSSVNFTWIVMPKPGEGDPNRVALWFDKTNADHVLRSIQYGPEATPLLDVHERQPGEMQTLVSGGR